MKNFSIRLIAALIWVSLSWFVSSAFAAGPTGAQEVPAAKVQAIAEDKINVNTASADALAEILTGIGPKKAEAIVAYREANGPFKSVDDLLQVKGIGPATLEKNRDRISL
jgi:competence protein ComEA helix-hairpin-helix repeat region